MEVKLSEIFIYNPDVTSYHRASLLKLDIQNEFGVRLASNLGLMYVQGESEGDNLCYAQTSQIRPGYRQYLFKSDILNYLDRTLEPCYYDMGSYHVVFPDSIDLF